VRTHIVLVGLSGSGKTSVGREAARRLECPFADIDGRLEEREGATIAELFRRRGETSFRELERQAVEVALGEAPGVVSPGAGWAAQPGNLEYVLPRATVIWLEVTPEAAARRLRGIDDRPLLKGEELEQRLRSQLAHRGPFYQRAHARLDSTRRDRSGVAEQIVTLARRLAWW
jgi:shikimate kinase